VGEVDIGAHRFAACATGSPAAGAARVVLVGGALTDGPFHISWDIFSWRSDRIEAAKAIWKSGRFAPGADNTIVLLLFLQFTYS
jgi:redox-sensitive bicupin YhaK (pirin superfamily)